MIIQPEMLEKKIMKLEVRRWEKKAFWKLWNNLFSCSVQDEQFAYHPHHLQQDSPNTLKNTIVTCSSYTQKELLSEAHATGALQVASQGRDARILAPIHCWASAQFCLAMTLLHPIHSFIIACKEKISHRNSTKETFPWGKRLR